MTPSPDEVAERLAWIRSVGVDALEAPDVVWLVDQLEQARAERDAETASGDDLARKLVAMEHERDAAIARAERAEAERDDIDAKSHLKLMAFRSIEKVERGRDEAVRAENNRWKSVEMRRLRERDAALAQVKTLREALEKLADYACSEEMGCGAGGLEDDEHVPECAVAIARAALAPDAGKAPLEWKESALHALGEWHEARELIGGAQLGDGPVQWAKRVRERLETTERDLAHWNALPPLVTDVLCADARAAALEDAAEVAESFCEDMPDPCQLFLEKCAPCLTAAAIRALKEKP